MKSIQSSSIHPLLDARLAAYAAAGVALAAPALTPSAKADIVYSGPLNLAVPQNGAGIYFDLATGANATASFTGYDINFYGTTALTFFRGTGTTLQAAAAGGTPAPLAAGTVIASTSPFSTSASSTAFQVAGSEYLGLRFTNTTTAAVNYGWVLLNTGAATTGYPASVVSYAYENTGAGIAAGAVPEPGTTAALGLGALALGAVGVRRLRKQKLALPA